MEYLEKKLPNGVVMKGIVGKGDGGSRVIGWYGAEFDSRGGLFHGVYSVDFFDVDDKRTLGALTRIAHGYVTEQPAEDEAKAAVRYLL